MTSATDIQGCDELSDINISDFLISPDCDQMARMPESLLKSEDVRQLILRIDKVKFDHTIFNMLLDEVKSDVYMLGSGMLDVWLSGVASKGLRQQPESILIQLPYGYHRLFCLLVDQLTVYHPKVVYYQLCTGVYLDNQHDRHLQMLLVQRKNPSDTKVPDVCSTGIVVKGGCQSFHDNVMDLQAFPSFSSPDWILQLRGSITGSQDSKPYF
ncbi:hypothetical protein Tco_0847220 [Tanacetum coccineum]